MCIFLAGTPKILPIKDIKLGTRGYAVQVMVIEKGLTKPSAKTSSSYKRVVLQDFQVIITHLKIRNSSTQTQIQVQLTQHFILLTGAQNPGYNTPPQYNSSAEYTESRPHTLHHECSGGENQARVSLP